LDETASDVIDVVVLSATALSFPSLADTIAIEFSGERGPLDSTGDSVAMPSLNVNDQPSIGRSDVSVSRSQHEVLQMIIQKDQQRKRLSLEPNMTSGDI
jgi:hypothetical protein